MNNSIDFKGTNKLYLDLRRESLPGDNIKCQRCETENLTHYWKVGFVDVDKRASIVCDTCHDDMK